MNTQQLLDLKKEIGEARETATELTGRKKQLMETLEKDWGCTTIPQAEKKAEKMDTDINQLNQQIKDNTAELEEKYLNDE